MTPQRRDAVQNAVARQKVIYQRLKAEMEQGLIDQAERDMINSPEVIYLPQENRMPRAKKTRRMNFWVDKEVQEALEALQKFYGPDVSISEIIREAIIEKAQIDAKQRKPDKKAG